MNQKKIFDLVRGALTSIEFYREHHASSELSAKHQAEVAQMLREVGQGNPQYQAFLNRIAEAIEKM